MKCLRLRTQKTGETQRSMIATSWGRMVMALALLVLTGPAWAGDGKAFVREYDSAQIQWGSCPAFMPESCGLAILQGDPKNRNTDVLFRLRSKTTAPHHWHTSAERMVLLAGEMKVDYDGQAPVVVKPGNYAYGPPELPHMAYCQSKTDCVLFISFDEPVDAFAVDK